MKKLVSMIGLALAILFALLAYQTEIPDKYISSWGYKAMHEYVGGDAYNYIIEASLRGGEISGAYTQRAIYYAAAAVLGLISLLGLVDKSDSQRKKMNENIWEINNNMNKFWKQFSDSHAEKPEVPPVPSKDDLNQ